MNVFLWILIVVFLSACGGHETLHAPITPELATVRSALEKAVAGTPYSALVRQTGVKRIAVQDENPHDDYAQDLLVYEATVLETFRGPRFRTVEYSTYARRGAATAVSEVPFILTLCHLDGEFHTPETGEVFPAQDALVKAAKARAVAAGTRQTRFEYCQ